ncbi:condensation domain-containing protein, partial [Agrobacterium tumefaciens]|uniref:condensation domain-containing protein n=1 Tax=Agrobacterium tumefaciens TaxID=358 RepID=UPI002244D5AD
MLESDTSSKAAKAAISPWRERIVLGERVGNVQIPEWLEDAYRRFSEDVLHPEFPCFFGTQAERRGEMFYSFVSQADLTHLPRTMLKFAELSQDRANEKNNFALFFEPDETPLDHDGYRKRFWGVLQYLHDHDHTITADTEVLDPSHPDWEFEFAGMQMFVVACTPSYQRRRSRNLGPGMIMLFQPRSVFIDAITQRAIGPQARDQVRKRLVVWDGVAHHPDLGVYGDPDNREWKQYFLSDDDEPNRGACPFLARKKDQELAAEKAARALNVPLHENVATTSDDTIVNRLTFHAANNPADIAVRFLTDGETEETVLSYSELDREARAFAAILKERTQPGDRAIMMFPTGLEYVVALFGCFHAGVIAVPAFPPSEQAEQAYDRLRSICNDCSPALLLTDEAGLNVATSFVDDEDVSSAEVLVVRRTDLDTSTSWTSPVGEEAIAFLQYTSGSTSMPKGVMISHGNLAANERLIGRAMEFVASDVMVSWAPLYHDMGLVGGLLGPIYHGFPVVLLSPQAFLERPSRWLKAIANHRGTVSGGPDFAYQLCLDRIRDTQLADLDLSSWRVAYCGAEPIRQQTMDAFAQRFAPSGLRREALYPCYGLAEGTLMATGSRPLTGANAACFDPAAIAQRRAIPASIGIGIIDCGAEQEGHRVRIVDPETHRELPEGEIGEVWLSGPSIALGYWNNRRASRETFVKSTDRDGETELRTGDLGFLHEGKLFISGRLKDLIIIRGQNVYPQDVEFTVGSTVDGLRKGRIAAFPIDRSGSDKLGIAAEVSLTALKKLGADRIIRAVRSAAARLHNEAPSLVLLLKPGDLPRTSSGKLRRSACLPSWLSGALQPLAVFHDQVDQGTGRPPYAAPETPLERLVAAAWEEILGIRPIGLRDDFLALGGQSLLAAQLSSKLADVMGIEIPTAFALKTTTVGEQAKAFADGTVTLPGIQAIARRQDQGAPVPLTREQEALWFLWRLAPSSIAYNVARTFQITGNVRLDVLRRAVERVVGRHEALRARFSEHDGVAHQSFLPTADFEWTEQDLSSFSPEEREAQQIELHLAALARPFDLAADPLLRVQWIRLGEHAGSIQFITHHIVADATSADVLLADVSALYEEEVRGAEPLSVSPRIGFGDFALWQRGMSAEPDQSQLAYWVNYLEITGPLIELGDRRRPGDEWNGQGLCHRHQFDPQTSAKARVLAARAGTTTFAVMLAAFQCLLHRFSGQDDICVGVPVSGREVSVTRAVIGDFVRLLVIRSKMNGQVSFRELLREAHQGLVDGRHNQDVPLTALVEALDAERGNGDNPLFNVTFNLRHSNPNQTLHFADIAVEEIRFQHQPVAFDLMVDVEDGDGLSVSWSYRTDLLDREVIESLAVAYEAIIGAVVEDDVLLANLQLSTVGITAPRDGFAFHGVAERVREQADRRPL